MMVSVYTEIPEKMKLEEHYHFSQIDALDREGNVIKTAENKEYMESVLEKYAIKRLEPKAYYTVTGNLFACIVIDSSDKKVMNTVQSHFMSIHYYEIILHCFYRLTLLKLSNEHSDIEVLNDQEHTEELIEQISRFSATYYFEEVSSRSNGIEMSLHLRKAFNLSNQYSEVKKTLEGLYRNQEGISARKQNSLLFLLTIFTVVSGIYGMNLIIDEWKKPLNLSNIREYNFFEWISFLTAVLGIGISIFIVFISGYRKLNVFVRKQKRKYYE
ncbi:hypothetical protein [Kurthia senegalensis]|uniref:hypothetical protein n=2 Tax=Kurthia senegalensis TaxID=1033740 RepID=UPI000307F756|nr:hypothetical protein [Kurthia senegalensis]